MQNESPTVLRSLHVADLAREADVTPATVRYYARTKLIHAAREPDNGYRCFSWADVHRVQFIRQAQSLGLTIGDIKTVLESVDHGDVPCHQVKSLVEERLVTIQERIADLQATEKRIRRATSTWEHMQDQTPMKGELCPLIERLETSENESLKVQQPPTHAQSSSCVNARANGSAQAVCAC